MQEKQERQLGNATEDSLTPRQRMRSSQCHVTELWEEPRRRAGCLLLNRERTHLTTCGGRETEGPGKLKHLQLIKGITQIQLCDKQML